MFWIRGILWALRKRNAVLLFLISLIIFLSFIVVVFVLMYQNSLMYWVVKKRAEDAFNSSYRKITSVYTPNYPTVGDPTSSAYDNDGVRGNGLNLLLIDRIQVEGYIKELLELYRESSNGTIDNSKYQLPLEALLAKHYNESSFYPGTVILKSLLPFDSSTKTVHWNKSRGEYPSEAFTLRKFNKNVMAVNGNLKDGSVGFYENGVHRQNSSYRNVFQIMDRYFLRANGAKSLLDGYLESSSRESDMYYLPDSLAYLNTQYSVMMDRFQFKTDNEAILSGLYGIWHNGGQGNLEYFHGFGTSSQSKLKYSASSRFSGAEDVSSVRDEWDKNISAVPTSIYNQTQRHYSKLSKMYGVGRSYGLAIWLLIEDGYYLDSNAIGYITSVPARLQYITEGYNVIYGKSYSTSQVLSVLRDKAKDPWEVYPGYINKSEFNRVYGNVSGSGVFDKGILWKLEEYTSSSYANQLRGKDPRVLHRTNLEVAGFVWDMEFRGSYVYANMLKSAGVGIDPTNPSEYMKVIRSEFIPPGADLYNIFEKIGVDVNSLDPRIYKMLSYGYDISGFWYYLGGQGLPVSQENWEVHKQYRYAHPKGSGWISNKVLTELIYATKDGTNPQDSAQNRRDSNLINLGKILLDCSQLIAQAYNNTIALETGRPIPSFSNSLYSSPMLTTIADWNNAKTGDIFVREGHVFFFLSKNTGTSPTSLTQIESKTELSPVARVGHIWVLEASDYNTRVGIRSRPMPDKSKYILRRFNEFM